MGPKAADDRDVRRHFALHQLFGLFAVSFSYAIVFNTIGTVVIPKEIERLAVHRQSLWVSLIMASGAVSQLATPVVGAWSDREGQRIPFLVCGSALVVSGLVFFMALDFVSHIAVLIVAQVTTAVGLSIQYSMVTALLNDHVLDEQSGKGSGAMAVLAILGSGTGYTLFAYGLPSRISYCAYIVATVTCLCMSVLSIPYDGYRRSRMCTVPICEALHNSLVVPSPQRTPDFFLACVGRALFNAGLGVQVFMVYFMRDIAKVADPVRATSSVAVMALLGGVAGALPSGMLSDAIGKKPVIYASIVTCVVSLVCFASTSSVGTVMAWGFVYGVGNVAYLSVDYALGVQVLPRRIDGSRQPTDAARDLGMFAMSATVGQLLGQLAYGVVLDKFGVTTPAGVRYPLLGFVTVFIMGAVCFLLSGVAVRFIRDIR